MLIFQRDALGDEQHNILLVEVQTGKVVQLTDTPYAQDFPVELSPDDQWLLFLSDRNGQQNLYKLHLRSQVVVQLTDYSSPVFPSPLLLGLRRSVTYGIGCRWSPDGRFIAYAANETANLNNSDIYLCDADGDNKRLVLQITEGSSDRAAAWSPNGRALLMSSDASGWNRVGLLSLEGGQVHWLTEDGVDSSPCGFSPDGKRVLTTRNQKSVISTVLYDVETGCQTSIQLPAGVTLPVGFYDDGRQLLLDHTTLTGAPELLLYDLKTGKIQPVLLAQYGSIDPGCFVDGEAIAFPSSDGLTVEGFLFKPRNIPQGTRLPALVQIHGGPAHQHFAQFDRLIQVLVDRGYVVLQPNVRGSTGYGTRFRDMNLRDWGGGDLLDVVAARDYLHQQAYVNPDRIGVIGLSYGGFMTFLQMVKQPDLWKIGIARCGITDLFSMYDMSNGPFKYWLRMYWGDFQENATLIEDRSAVNFAENLRAKLLITHGVHDARCPVEQARVFRDRLLDLGHVEGEDFEYVEFEDEGHSSYDPAHKIRVLRIMLDFLKRSL